jgi:hypothetical protein
MVLKIERRKVRMDEQSKGLIVERAYYVQLFASQRDDGSLQYRSVIFPADHPTSGSLVCEKWHEDESMTGNVLENILPSAVDRSDVLNRAQSVEGWMMKLELSEPEAVLLGWQAGLADGRKG